MTLDNVTMDKEVFDALRTGHDAIRDVVGDVDDVTDMIDDMNDTVCACIMLFSASC